MADAMFSCRLIATGGGAPVPQGYGGDGDGFLPVGKRLSAVPAVRHTAGAGIPGLLRPEFPERFQTVKKDPRRSFRRSRK